MGVVALPTRSRDRTSGSASSIAACEMSNPSAWLLPAARNAWVSIPLAQPTSSTRSAGPVVAMMRPATWVKKLRHPALLQA